jgi:hypothetical protein
VSAIARDLAKLVEEHGARAVLETLRDACSLSAECALENGAPSWTQAARWREASDAIMFAAVDIAIAERRMVWAPLTSTRVDAETETPDPAMTLAGALRVLAK